MRIFCAFIIVLRAFFALFYLYKAQKQKAHSLFGHVLLCLFWWRRGESNPCPKNFQLRLLQFRSYRIWPWGKIESSPQGEVDAFSSAAANRESLLIVFNDATSFCETRNRGRTCCSHTRWETRRLLIRREQTKGAAKQHDSHSDNCYQLLVFDVYAHHATAILAKEFPVKTGTSPEQCLVRAKRMYYNPKNPKAPL